MIIMIFVVAEIGVNWDGDMDLVKKMMIKSKQLGCNAVKFQAFNENLVGAHPQRSRLMNSSITEKNVETINNLAKLVGIEWFCTPMYPEAVDFLEPFIKKFKIREKDGLPLLQNKKTDLFKKIYETDKEIIISSNSLPKKSSFYGDPRIKWLYCVPKYPCKLEDLDFRNLNDFDGYSNHCPHLIAPLSSAVLGTKIIEIHITSDKKKDFVDNVVSFDFEELKILMEFLRDSEKIKK